MRKLFAVPAILGMIVLMSGCASVPESQTSSADVAVAKQTVKIYDVAPANSSPLDQISATSCDTREAATDQLIATTSQRGGNGMAQLSCKDEGFTMACFSSTTCTATALVVTEPPPRPVVPPAKPKPAKPKAKKKP